MTERTERGDDFEFDFFEDEPETQDAGETQRIRMPRVGGPGRSARPPTGLTPLLRLAGLIAFAILIVVLLVVWVSSCQGQSKRQAFERYMANVAVIAKDSQGVGRQLSDLLTAPGVKTTDIAPKITGLAQQEKQNAT